MIIFSGRGRRFCLDDHAGTLWRETPGSEQVHLPPKQWKLLRCFAQNPGRLIEKSELQEKVWGVDNTNVSEASVSRAISDLRRALGDPVNDPHFIEVAHGRGYRFVATIESGISTTPPTHPVPGPPEHLHAPVASNKILHKRTRAPNRYICDQMSESIKRRCMGPFPTARPIVYQALESYIAAKARLPLSALVEAAVQKAKQQMGESTQPWAAIRAVTEKQLLRSGAALDEHGRPLPDAWPSKALAVHSLADDWRRRAEGEILLALFNEQDVKGDQLLDVARAVCGSSSSMALSEVQSVLQRLIDAGRVGEDGHGIFRVNPSQP